jgi:hypothetical protein
MFNFMDRYNLWNCAAFKDDGGGGGGGGGGGDDKPAKKTVGSVSKTGQYAGDGFEWVDNGGYLTRTYTGANKDAGLGQDVRTGGTEDKAVKEAIASISLNEGSEFAASKASVTDYDALDIFRSPENQTASSSFAEQAGVDDYTPTITYGDTPTPPTPQAKTFGEEFAEARKAGQDTFTYNGNLYTTELAPEPAAPSVSYDAFGNTYSTPEAAAEADQTMAQQAAAAAEAEAARQDKVLEAKLFEQPVVSDDAQKYLDDLGTDFDFTQFDEPSIDYTVSQGEAGRGGDDTAAPTFSYEPGVDPAKEILVNLKNTAPETLSTSEYLQATQYENERAEAAPEPGVSVVSPITASDVSATATNPRLGYESGQDVLQSSADYLTGLDGSGPNTVGQVTDAFYGGEGAPVSPAYAMQDAAELAEMAEKKPLSESILDALYANTAIDKALGTDFLAPYATNIAIGGAKFFDTLGAKTGDVIDRASDTQTNLTLERMRDMGPMSNAQEEAMIRQAAFEGQQIRDRNLSPVDTSAYDYLSELVPIDYMKEYAEETVPGYEGTQNIYKGLKRYEDVVGFEPGQIDRQLLDAAQEKQTALETGIFGQGPGSAVRMDGSSTGFDPSTFTQKSLEGAGSSIAPLVVSTMGPLGMLAGAGLGYASVGGELMEETDQTLQGLYDTGRLQNSDRFRALSAEMGEAEALNRMKSDARGLTKLPAAALGGGATAAEAALLRMGLPGAAAVPIIEALQEGPGENIAANQIVATVTGFGTPLDRKSTLETTAAGAGGGAAIAVPAAGAQAFVPTGPRAGQPAASTVPTEYTEDLMDTGMRGVGDVTSDASSMEVIAAEKIIEDQVASTGTVDPKVAENLKDRTGLSSEEINNMAEKAGAPAPLDDAPNVPAEEAPVDLGGIPSRLTLTGAESLGPTTPDLSGIASRLNLSMPQTPAIPTDPATPVLQKNGVATTYGEAVANERVTATQQLDNARIAGEYTPAGDTIEEQLANFEKDIQTRTNELVAENYTMPTDAITSKMDSDAAAPAQQAAAAAAQTAIRKPSASASMDELNKAADDIQSRFNLTFDEANDLVDNAYKALLNRQGTAPADTNYQNAVNLVNDQGVVSAAYVQRQLGISYDQAQDAVQRMEDEGLISAPNHVGKRTVNTEAVSAAATPEVKSRISPEIKALAEAARAEETPVFTSVRTPDAAADAVFTSVRGGIPAAADAAITSKMDADAAATQEEDVAAVVELPEEFQEQLELPLEEEQQKQLEEEQQKQLEEEQQKQLEEEQQKQLEEEQQKQLEEEQKTTTVVVPTITQIPEPGEDEEVEVELEPEEPEVEPEVTTEVDEEIDVLIPPITSTDDDGNTITECPEGYEMVQTADGPMCQKSVSSTRQRAGASTRAYTGLSGNVGRRGPGQKRKTTTSTQRVRPTIRSA